MSPTDTALQSIATPNAPTPIGHYSQAVRSGGMVVVAGQVGVNPLTNVVAGPTVEEQTRQTVKNIDVILRAAGAALEDVLQVTVYLVDVEDFAAMNTVYARYMPGVPPARATVYVGLPEGLRVEMSALAVVGSGCDCGRAEP